jgi:hypothetical protein
MKLFKKTESKKKDAIKIHELTEAELKIVSGGINPQPLPPGRHITL